MRIRRRPAVALLLIFLIHFAQRGRAQQPSGIETQNSAGSSTPALDLTPGPDGKLSAEQMHRLFQVVSEKDLENERRRRDFRA